MLNELEKWVLNEMVWHLQEMEGQEVNVCELAFSLFETENINGSYNCSAYDANQWIKAHWFDLSEVVEEYEDEFGEYPANCWTNPEVFQVQIIIYMACQLISNSKFIENYWNEEIRLTKEVINIIAKEWSDCL